MKYIQNPEVEVINLKAADVMTASLTVGDKITEGTVKGDAPVRPAIFDTPAANNEGGTIWQ